MEAKEQIKKIIQDTEDLSSEKKRYVGKTDFIWHSARTAANEQWPLNKKSHLESFTLNLTALNETIHDLIISCLAESNNNS